MNIERRTRRGKEIPLTPLIDVVFLLIVFFMLTTSFIKIDSIEINLPPAEDAEKENISDDSNGSKNVADEIDNLIVIDIANSGKLYVNQKPFTLADLLRKLPIMARGGEKKVLVRVADRVTVQKMVSIMDIVHSAKIRDVSIGEWDGIIYEDSPPKIITPESTSPAPELSSPTAGKATIEGERVQKQKEK